MNLYYELLQYPVFSMKEVNTLYANERTARVALGKLLKEKMVYKIRNGLYTCFSKILPFQSSYYPAIQKDFYSFFSILKMISKLRAFSKHTEVSTGNKPIIFPE